MCSCWAPIPHPSAPTPRLIARFVPRPLGEALLRQLHQPRNQLREGQAAEASKSINALEKEVALAQLTMAHSGLEHQYDETGRDFSGRVIEYVPSTKGAPIRLDATAPSALDATGQKLLAHVRRAVVEFESTGGITQKEMEAVRAAPIEDQRTRYEMYRGSAIDRLAKKAVFDDGELEHVYVTVNREKGADFYDSRTGRWYDMTTIGQWRRHEVKYGPTQPGKTTIPGSRLPIERA